MKKYLSLMLVIVLCLSLVSCKAEIDNEDKATKDEGFQPLTDNNPEYAKTNYASCFLNSNELYGVYTVSVNDTIYGTDKNGLWKCVNNKGIEYISDKNISNFVTNGETIFYNCYNDDYYEYGELWTMDYNGKNDTLILKDANTSDPLMIFGNKAFYINHEDVQVPKLCSIDIENGNVEEIDSNISAYAVVDKTIYYLAYSSDDTYASILKCYDPSTLQVLEYPKDIAFSPHEILPLNNGVVVTTENFDHNTDECCSVIYHISLHDTHGETTQLTTLDSEVNYFSECNGNLLINTCNYNSTEYYFSISDGKLEEIESIGPYVQDTICCNSNAIFSTSKGKGSHYIYFDSLTQKLKTIDNFSPEEKVIVYCSDDILYYIEKDEIKTETIKLSDKLPSSAVAVGIEKSRTDSPATQYVYTKIECDYESTFTLSITDQYGSPKVLTKNRLPQLNLDSEDAKKINKEITNNFEHCIEDPDSGFCEYEAYLNSNILSLVIESRADHASILYIYNLDVNTGKQLSTEEIFEHTSISQDEAYNQLRDIITAIYEPGSGKNAEESGKEVSLSEDNIKNSEFYFDASGNLIVRYTYHGTPGSGSTRTSSTLNGSFIY